MKNNYYQHNQTQQIITIPQITKTAMLLLIISFPSQIFAYVGPGAGITFLGALWAVITAILLAIGGFLIWPIKALLRRRKMAKQGTNPAQDNTDTNKKN